MTLKPLTDNAILKKKKKSSSLQKVKGREENDKVRLWRGMEFSLVQI